MHPQTLESRTKDQAGDSGPCYINWKGFRSVPFTISPPEGRVELDGLYTFKLTALTNPEIRKAYISTLSHLQK